MIRIPGGLLVAVEGIDGAGKTSVATLLAQFCGERGIGCVLSKEPTGLRWGTELRRSASEGRLTLERELELFELDRQDHVQRSILPGLKEGNVVILDRYYWSSAAYQGSRGADFNSIIAKNESFAPRPNLTILLDIDTQTGINRILNRGDKPNLFETKDSLEKAREIFSNLSKMNPDTSKIDSSVSLREVQSQVLSIFVKCFTQKLAESQEMNPQMINTVLALLGGDLIRSV
ncbi:dTMP kinase [Armatimonas sp.]|uniref:dTMP kinase n=1 Tax=Armatimonas sp. TaxID=1872638 RepID=UPI00286C4FF8|nr:dTMP kinase [Armatimonas sp.]